MERYLKSLDNQTVQALYFSLGLFILYMVIKFFLYKWIDRSEDLGEVDKVLAKNKTKNTGRFLVVLAVISVWFSQIQTVFVSFLVFATAFVLALKEVIMCFTGGLLIKFNRLFKVGDRIEIAGNRGYVLERSVTMTKVLELGKERNSQQTTGNVLAIPNSLFLTNGVVNQSYFQGYSIRSFTFSKLEGCSNKETEEILLKLAWELCEDYLEQARESISKSCRKEGIIIPDIEPQVKLTLSDENKVHFLLKMPVDNRRIAQIEQSLVRGFLGSLDSEGF